MESPLFIGFARFYAGRHDVASEQIVEARLKKDGLELAIVDLSLFVEQRLLGICVLYLADKQIHAMLSVSVEQLTLHHHRRIGGDRGSKVSCCPVEYLAFINLFAANNAHVVGTLHQSFVYESNAQPACGANAFACFVRGSDAKGYDVFVANANPSHFKPVGLAIYHASYYHYGSGKSCVVVSNVSFHFFLYNINIVLGL